MVQLGTWELPKLSWYLTDITFRLDLTVASRAYIMEPQWNPMAEEQALDRIHRLGQTRPVTTIRYIMKDTWEEVSVLDERLSSAKLTVSECGQIARQKETLSRVCAFERGHQTWRWQPT